MISPSHVPRHVLRAVANFLYEGVRPRLDVHEEAFEVATNHRGKSGLILRTPHSVVNATSTLPIPAMTVKNPLVFPRPFNYHRPALAFEAAPLGRRRPFPRSNQLQGGDRHAQKERRSHLPASPKRVQQPVLLLGTLLVLPLLPGRWRARGAAPQGHGTQSRADGWQGARQHRLPALSLLGQKLLGADCRDRVQHRLLPRLSRA